jgi:hypothetical protein
MPGIFKSKGENLSSNQDELEKVRERDVTGVTNLREIEQNFKNQTIDLGTCAKFQKSSSE